MFGEIQARHALDLVEPIGNGFLVSSRSLAATCREPRKEHAQGLQQSFTLRALFFQERTSQLRSNEVKTLDFATLCGAIGGSDRMSDPACKERRNFLFDQSRYAKQANSRDIALSDIVPEKAN